VTTSKRLEAFGDAVPFAYFRVLESNEVTEDIRSQDSSEPGVFNWQASTIVNGLSLHDLAYHASYHQPLPRALLAHIAIKLCDALRWAHGLDAPLYHNDICLSNILLDMQSRDASGMPGIALVDWDAVIARESESVDLRIRDRRSFF
jgi:serine/threonine protein kinase